MFPFLLLAASASATCVLQGEALVHAPIIADDVASTVVLRNGRLTAEGQTTVMRARASNSHAEVAGRLDLATWTLYAPDGIAFGPGTRATWVQAERVNGDEVLVTLLPQVLDWHPSGVMQRSVPCRELRLANPWDAAGQAPAGLHALAPGIHPIFDANGAEFGHYRGPVPADVQRRAEGRAEVRLRGPYGVVVEGWVDEDAVVLQETSGGSARKQRRRDPYSLPTVPVALPGFAYLRCSGGLPLWARDDAGGEPARVGTTRPALGGADTPWLQVRVPADSGDDPWVPLHIESILYAWAARSDLSSLCEAGSPW